MIESRSTARGYDAACDVWSLGVIVYMMLSSTPPFGEAVDSDDLSQPVTSIFDQIRRGIRSDVHFRSEPWPSVSSAATPRAGCRRACP